MMTSSRLEARQTPSIRRSVVRIDRIFASLLGLGLGLTEVSLRSRLDLPLAELTLVFWALAELFTRRLRFDLDRRGALYLLAATLVLLATSIVIADTVNGQSWSTTVRNVLKYLILFLVLAWFAHSPSLDRVASFLLGALIGVALIGFAVLRQNPETPYVAKYFVPYAGSLVLAALAGARPFKGGWRFVTVLSAVLITALAVAAQARWSALSAVLVLALTLLPRSGPIATRASIVVAALVPAVPLIFLGQETALALIWSQDLRSASEVERLLLYAFAHESIQTNPWFGIGFENFTVHFERRFGDLLLMQSSVQGPHNQYAAVGALFGLPTLVFYAAAAASALNLVYVRRKSLSRLTLPSIGMLALIFSANEVSDDARLVLYLTAALLAIGEQPARSVLAALLSRPRSLGADLRRAQAQPAGMGSSFERMVARDGSRA